MNKQNIDEHRHSKPLNALLDKRFETITLVRFMSKHGRNQKKQRRQKRQIDGFDGVDRYKRRARKPVGRGVIPNTNSAIRYQRLMENEKADKKRLKSVDIIITFTHK